MLRYVLRRDMLSLGAVITALELAFDAFTQQVLTTQYINTFSVVFLVVIILKTRSVGMMPWKGSALAWLFLSVDEELKNHSRAALGKPDGLLKATSEPKVALREKDGF
ncbi:hypothetical protein ONS96_009248 [Cadophora gregata f. sp. sojae]|nr:hypothetical protein ONS96_009248 [Cadophora gregata f. sp. sojae]